MPVEARRSAPCGCTSARTRPRPPTCRRRCTSTGAALRAADIDFLRPVELRPALRADEGGWLRLPGREAAWARAAIEGLRTGAGTLAISEENLLGLIRDSRGSALPPARDATGAAGAARR